MARPIPLETPPRDPREELRSRLARAPVEHAEALLSGYEVLQSLHDHGVLELLRGLLGGGGKVLEIAVEAAQSPDTIRGVRNFLLLTKFFAGIPPDVLHSLVETARTGAEREKARKAPGLLSLAGRLNNEDSRRAMSVALDLLEALGKGL